MKNVLLSLVYVTFFFLLLLHSSLPAYASVSDWQKNASITPKSPTDFSSNTFKQSLTDLAMTHANYVTLIIPYYQTNLTTTDLQSGWNTPTDQSLTDAITSAHTLGLHVMLKIHAESNTGEWRAHINPSDRAGWFSVYGNILTHYGTLAQQQGVEEYCLGAELYDMTSPNVDASNTNAWNRMIQHVRDVYKGSLTYSAQRINPSEADEIAFWNQLDYLGLSAYYELDSNNPSPTVDSLKNSWDTWNTNAILPLYQKWNKPILFTEIGYRSVNAAHTDPWDDARSGSVDEGEQARDYEALFSYWDTQSYMKGVNVWEWDSDPAAGGSTTTTFTPQHKQALAVITNWFGGNASTQLSSTPTTTPSITPSPSLTPTPSITASPTPTLSVTPETPSPLPSATITPVPTTIIETNQLTATYRKNKRRKQTIKKLVRKIHDSDDYLNIYLNHTSLPAKFAKNNPPRERLFDTDGWK